MIQEWIDDKTALSPDDLAVYTHYKKTLPAHVILPMMKPDGTLGYAKIAPYSTEILKLLIQNIRHVIGQVLVRNSNPCQCWRQILVLEEKQIQLQDAWIGNPDGKYKHRMTKTEIQQRIHEMDIYLEERFPIKPPRFAESMNEPVCQNKHCKKLREIDMRIALSEDISIQNFMNILGIDKMPLFSIVPFIAWVADQIYNEDFIPEPQKKMVTAFVQKYQVLQMRDTAIHWLTTIASPSPSMTNVTSTNFISEPEAGDRPMWTEPSPPESETSSTTKPLSDDDKS